MAPLDAIADILKARGVAEVRYLHADHFEPWSAGVDVGRRAIERFEAQTRDLPFGSAASLFYKVRLGGRLDDAANPTAAGHRVPDDGIVFKHPGTAYRSAAGEAMGVLDRETGPRNPSAPASRIPDPHPPAARTARSPAGSMRTARRSSTVSGWRC